MLIGWRPLLRSECPSHHKTKCPWICAKNFGLLARPFGVLMVPQAPDKKAKKVPEEKQKASFPGSN
jgi:hypothetical protein